METGELLTQVRRSERQLSAQLEKLKTENESRISGKKNGVRKKVKEVLNEEPQQKVVREHIEQLQLRLELLRNIRLNWKNFENHAHERGIDLRINQFSALQHLISFLETGKGQENEQNFEKNRSAYTSRSLMAYEVQPTGAGKTGAFAIETALLDVPTLILVPFDNLVEQSKEDLIKIGGIAAEDIGLVYAETKEFGRKVTIATYQGHTAQMKKGGVYATHVQNNVKFCICDEVHTSLGDRTQEGLESIDGIGNGKLSINEKSALDAEQYVLRHLDKEVSVKALKIGYTATPKLAQKHVQQYFPHFLGRVYHRDMVDAGILVPYRIVQCDGSVFEGEIGKNITEEQEINILKREHIYEKLIGEYIDALHEYEKMKQKNAYPLRGMAFCTNHDECEKFSKQAKALGLNCEIITGREAHGKQGREIINNAKEKLCNGDIDLIVTVEKLCAGFNFPEVNAIIWARITSMAKTIQGVGRGGRSHKEGKREKICCWVFETNWALKKNAKRGRKPLRIADALAQNGEDPKAICTMANGSELQHVETVKVDDDGTASVHGRLAIAAARYSLNLGLGENHIRNVIQQQNIEPIKNIRGLSNFTPVDLYWKDEIDSLLPKFLDDQGIVDIDGKLAVGLYNYTNSRNLGLGWSAILRLVHEAKLNKLTNIRVFSGDIPVDVYWKDEVDALLPRHLDENGVVVINGKEAVGLKPYANSL
ncbi:MAG TPA: DEAD/DEAH box helicase family protein, partial [Candidatus Babeliaceae bacterium]|nr:DEAD/DEAH box helicase family protein [Candidatus Babeliaceae bacterium]